MGLDMYVYMVKKPTGFNKNAVYDYDSLCKDGYSLFPFEEVDGWPGFDSMLPFCEKVKCKTQYYNLEKIAKAYNLGEDTHCCGFGPDGDYFCSDGKEITISNDDINKYVLEAEVEMYVVRLEEVLYWRKNWELQNALHNYYIDNKNIEIENCGYYTLDNNAVKIIKQFGNLVDDAQKDFEGYDICTLVYHEWY